MEKSGEGRELESVQKDIRGQGPGSVPPVLQPVVGDLEA